MAEPDRLEGLRQELADVEQALEEEQVEPGRRAEIETRRRELEAEVAALQNPVGPAVAGEIVDVDPEDYRPDGAELVVAPSGEDLWLVLDAHDEDQILQEFQRRALKVMLYDFPKDGNRVVDLSYQGVNEAVRLINNTGKAQIRINPSVLQISREVIDGREFVAVRVYAEDNRTGYGQFGTAREPIHMTIKAGTAEKFRKQGVPVVEEVRDGTKVFSTFDKFAETKALNKAQRNALKVMIPERMRQALIAMHKGDETSLKQIAHGAGAVAEAEMPAPLESAEAKALNVEIRKVYAEVRTHSVNALLPGQFGNRLRRSQHDVTLLEAFRDELVGLRDHLQQQGGES